MKLKAIKSKKDYQTYLDWVDKQFDNKAKTNTAKDEDLKMILLLIKQHEDKHYPIPLS